MTGIYEDKFLLFLKDNLGENSVRVRSNSITCRCPWCELNKEKKHYHLWISTEIPVFNCFFAGCGNSGHISKLIKKIKGSFDTISDFIDQDKLKSLTKQSNISLRTKKEQLNVILPEIKEDAFVLKSLYLKKRLGFAQTIDLKNINPAKKSVIRRLRA